MSALSWLIVGGGIHGVHLAVRLIGECDIAAESVRIIDPASRLLARWRACTRETGMTHLRSPSVHHLDLNPFSLQKFAGKRRRRKRGLFASPYERPALHLFDAHCENVVEKFGLAQLHIRQRAVACTVDCDGVAVRLSNEEALRAPNVILAIGASDQPQWPNWAPKGHPRVHHIFDPRFRRLPMGDRESVAVVGGGISAAQTVLRLNQEGHNVHLIARHPLRQHQFDSDPGWLGPRHMTQFSRERDLALRRRIISDARHRGSVSPDIYRALRRAIDQERVRWHQAEINDVLTGGSSLRLLLSDAGVAEVQRVLLATGFATKRPGGAMIEELVRSASLPCAACGYPIVDSALRWHPRIHVSGPLAELELGPASRNVAGARRSGDRLVRAVRSQSPAQTHQVS